MRVVATEYLSLDGVFEEPGKWSGPFFNDEAGQFKWGELRASDALLLGRKTYESFAAAWPSVTDDAGFADRMNSMPTHVASSTLDCCDWSGSQPLTGDVAEKVRALKKEPGRDLLLRKRPALQHAEAGGHHRLVPAHGAPDPPRQGPSIVC